MYPLLRDLHSFIGQSGLVVSLIMLAVASYTGYRKGDVTPPFRYATYAVAVLIFLQAALGGWLTLLGGRPGQPVHYVYGLGALLALPFFIFVEVTAKKRPAMSSYIWGFALLGAIIIRTILTGGLR